MDKERLLQLLAPFRKEASTVTQPGRSLMDSIEQSIGEDEYHDTAIILRELFANPLDPHSDQSAEVPGAHELFQRITARIVRMDMRDNP